MTNDAVRLEQAERWLTDWKAYPQEVFGEQQLDHQEILYWLIVRVRVLEAERGRLAAKLRTYHNPETYRKELLARFSNELSMEEIASCAYALAAREEAEHE